MSALRRDNNVVFNWDIHSPFVGYTAAAPVAEAILYPTAAQISHPACGIRADPLTQKFLDPLYVVRTCGLPYVSHDVL